MFPTPAWIATPDEMPTATGVVNVTSLGAVWVGVAVTVVAGHRVVTRHQREDRTGRSRQGDGVETGGQGPGRAGGEGHRVRRGRPRHRRGGRRGRHRSPARPHRRSVRPSGPPRGPPGWRPPRSPSAGRPSASVPCRAEPRAGGPRLPQWCSHLPQWCSHRPLLDSAENRVNGPRELSAVQWAPVTTAPSHRRQKAHPSHIRAHGP